MIKTADRLSGIEEYYFSKKLAEIAALNAQGRDIINLGIGSPDMAPPPSAIKQLQQAADQPDAHGYQSYKGIPELREAFSRWYKTIYNVDLDPNKEVLPLIGSKEGIIHISMSYLQSGDAALVPNPGYPAYIAATKLAGASPLPYVLKEENDWLPDLNAIEKMDLSNVKLMWVNYPHMPTGAAGSKELFEELIEFGQRHNILICNDNPYSLVLNDAPNSIIPGKPNEHALELNSLSKSHNMAGWRVGTIVGHEDHITNILKFKSNVDSGMFRPVQLAAVDALSQSSKWFNSINEEYRARRAIVYQILQNIGFLFDKNQAGLFVWAKVSDEVVDVDQWVNETLYEKQVFITPGKIFGSQGERFVRISLCSSQETLNEALNRLNK
ncbi:MAG: aminotransferase class I/II-fold pyridoxal phosphate-dependent enzyme [Fulvivirga sp.]